MICPEPLSARATAECFHSKKEIRYDNHDAHHNNPDRNWFQKMINHACLPKSLLGPKSYVFPSAHLRDVYEFHRIHGTKKLNYYSRHSWVGLSRQLRDEYVLSSLLHVIVDCGIDLPPDAALLLCISTDYFQVLYHSSFLSMLSMLSIAS